MKSTLVKSILFLGFLGVVAVTGRADTGHGVNVVAAFSEPAYLLVIGTGLAGIAAIIRKRSKSRGIKPLGKYREH